MICVIGLGYVGLPLAVAFAKVGFRVWGIDVDADRVRSINNGASYIGDITGEVVAELVAAKRLEASADYDLVQQSDVVLICVPTPFTPHKSPDLSHVVAAASEIAIHIQPGQLILLQSTTYPGTTEEVVLPILEKSGLKAGVDFYLSFSPERISPGDKRYTVENTPKVIGGLTSQCAELAAALFGQMSSQVHIVSSPRVAEMTKLLENTFRSVNIALVNELAKLCERMGLDIWEVIEAASTKPFGFMPFYPGPGVGGHCIAVDPYYLLWKAREYDFYTKFIELAAEVNLDMPFHVVAKVAEALSTHRKCLRGAKIVVLGVAYKKDIGDARNAPAERIIELLLRSQADVVYNDPYVPEFKVGSDVFYHEERVLRSMPLNEDLLQNADCVVIISGHTCYDYSWIVAKSPLIVDATNATRDVGHSRGKIVRLGAPHWRGQR
ncbi:MAG: nucleotide sugar dehydrogenase [Chloroflexi bacterium]|nr:nucleotide sugar dehydrogenase [Chloroflexota bacterium]